MQRLLYLLCLSVLVFSCEKEQKETGFSINGTIDNIPNGKMAKLFRYEAGKYKTLDSSAVQDGKIALKGSLEFPDLYFLSIDDIEGSLPIIVENEKITVTLYKDSLFKSSIKGGKETKVFNKYNQYLMGLQKDNEGIISQYQEAVQAKDTSNVRVLREKFDAIKKIKDEYDITFMKENNDGVLSALILERSLNKNLISPKTMKEIFDGFSENVKNSRAGLNIRTNLNKLLATAIGSTAPNFSAPSVDGKVLNLNDIRGKVTIVDFWAAWCGPCRRENPNLVKLYNKYHAKGLEIVGVSLDGAPNQKIPKDDWTKAIETDGLTWHQVSNLKYFKDPIAKQYNIRSIPATFILDSEGKIIYKNLRGQNLEDKIAELLD